MAERSEEESSESSATLESIDEVRVLEVEVMFSKRVLHSSCNANNKNNSFCAASQYSHLAPTQTADSNESLNPKEKSPTTRKFKNIALPNWLVKPHHAKKSPDEGGFTKHFHLHGNKKKIIRANSAPKKLAGSSGMLKLELKDPLCDTIVEGNEEGRLSVKTDSQVFRPKSPIMPRLSREEVKEKPKGHLWRRRASLPAQVNKMFTEGIKVPNSSAHRIPEPNSLTPEANRKQFNSTDKIEKDVLKALLFGRSHLETNKIPTKTTLYPELNRTKMVCAGNKFNNEEMNNNDLKNKNVFLNHQTPIPRLQLHKMETPDLFFVPDFDEDAETDARLDKKISVSASELHTAKKIDNEILEAEFVQTLISRDLKNYLEDKTFAPEHCQNWCIDISQSIKNSVQDFKGDEYKIVAVVYIAAIREKGVHAAVQCLWTPDQDCIATASYQNDSLFAFGSLIAMKYE